MENNENFVADQATENVEQTTEQTPKLYTEEEFHAKVNEATGKRVARIQKKMDRQYGNLIATLEAGTGKKGVEELDEVFRNHYTSRGVKMPDRTPEYSEKDTKYLAEREANEIISDGMEAVVDMTDYLANKGVAKMNGREKALFEILATHRQSEEKNKEYADVGIPADVYNSDEFKNIAKQFNPDAPAAEVYDFYRMKHPKKEIRTMGSMKSHESGDAGVKEFYSVEEARRFSVEDLRKNPALEAALWNSARKWK